MSHIRCLLRRSVAAVRGELGAVATEYGLILTLVVLAIILGVTLFGGALVGLLQRGPDSIP
jgi:Flp pilus assembly pilin Flp